MSNIRVLFSGAIVIVVWNGFSALATVYDSDGSSTNIQYIYDTLAVDGDTVLLPSGTFTWTEQLTITRKITLQGNTTTDPVNGTDVQNTIIKDNISNRSNHIIYFPGNCEGGFRITGIAFVGQNTGSMYNGALCVDGAVAPFRIDHCYFHGLHAYPSIGVFTPGGIGSVLDHNVKDDSVTGNEGFCHFYAGANTDNGDSFFRQPAGWGGPNFLFLEYNYMDGGTDLTSGGKSASVIASLPGTIALGNTERLERFLMEEAVALTKFTTASSYTTTIIPVSTGRTAAHRFTTTTPYLRTRRE